MVEMKNKLNVLASLLHELMTGESIINLCEGFKFIPVDWIYDSAIFTNQIVKMPAPKKVKTGDNNSSDEENAKKKQPATIQRYVYNVPYLFSKVDKEENLDKVMNRVTKNVDY